MDRMIVTVFNDERGAYEGAKALRALHAEGSITEYAEAVITKDLNGKVSIKQESDPGLAGTAVGLATGSLIGLLGGPVGLAAGAATGMLSGSLYDVAQAGVGEDFLSEVSRRLTPGTTAVVAEIDEDWVTPLDTRMEALGGVVFRRARGEFIDAQIEKELAADKAEVAALKAERDQAVGEARAKLQAKIDARKGQLKARHDKLNEKIAEIKRDGDAKLKTLQDQAAKASGAAKAQLEKRINEARADHKARVDKLSQAWRLIEEAAAI